MRGLDRNRYQVLVVVTVFSQQREQPGQAGRVGTDPALRHNSAVFVDDGHVVMVVGPIDSAGGTHRWEALSARSPNG
jgi:hypothetical protein